VVFGRVFYGLKKQIYGYTQHTSKNRLSYWSFTGFRWSHTLTNQKVPQTHSKPSKTDWQTTIAWFKMFYSAIIFCASYHDVFWHIYLNWLSNCCVLWVVYFTIIFDEYLNVCITQAALIIQILSTYLFQTSSRFPITVDWLCH